MPGAVCPHQMYSLPSIDVNNGYCLHNFDVSSMTTSLILYLLLLADRLRHRGKENEGQRPQQIRWRCPKVHQT